MYKFEEFESMLRTSAAEHAKVGIIFTGGYINPETAQKIKATHQELLQNDPAYKDLFATYKSSYLKLNDLITRAEKGIPTFDRNGPVLDQWKSIALNAFQMVAMVVRLPEAAIATVREDNAVQKMFTIYTDKTLG